MRDDRRLTDADVEAIARRVAAHLREPERDVSRPAQPLLTVREVAACYQLAPAAVYRLAALLGAIDLAAGRGKRQLRFRADAVEAALRDLRADQPPPAPAPRPAPPGAQPAGRRLQPKAPVWPADAGERDALRARLRAPETDRSRQGSPSR